VAADAEAGYDLAPARLKALRSVGVPYPEGYENGPAQKELEAQAAKIVMTWKSRSVTGLDESRVIAVIGYLQRPGRIIRRAGGARLNPAK